MPHNLSTKIKYSIESHNVYFAFTVQGIAETKMNKSGQLSSRELHIMSKVDEKWI